MLQNRDVVGYRKYGVSSQQLPNGSSADRVRRELAAADRQRRAGAADLVLWRAAPLAAVLCIAVAAAGRWRGWSAGWALALLSLAAAGLTTRWLLSRRARTLSDAVAAGIDETAGLGGELRSASWFASADTAGPWTDHHLARAATRLAASDWTRLFPVAPAWRAKTVTAILVVCTLGLALVLPRHHPLLTSEVGRLHAATGSLPSASAADALLPELQKQLEALLAAAERTGGPPSGTPATADDIRRLIAALGTLRDAGKLQDLARAMSERPVPRPEDAP